MGGPHRAIVQTGLSVPPLRSKARQRVALPFAAREGRRS